MPIIQVLTKQDQTIKIKLLDNPFIEDFVKQLAFVNENFKVCSYNQSIPNMPHPVWDSNDIENQVQIIRSAINTINDTGVAFPIASEDVVINNDEQSRQLLNHLHRHFTTSHRSISHEEEICTWGDGSTFYKPENHYTLTGAIHEINTAVHNIETYFNNSRIKRFKKYYELQIQFNSWEPKDPSSNAVNRYLVDIKDEHYQYFSDQLVYDVWLPLSQIQGKDYWRAYFDYDDPTEWDISTNVQYSGCMAIADRSAAKYPVILDYLKSYGITPGPLQCGMPLGNIIEGKEHLSSLRDNGIKCVII